MPGQTIADIARQYKNRRKNTYLQNALKRIGAINATQRIIDYGCNENGEKIKVTLWFKQQLRLTADNRLRHVLTTGASQISKSLANYLVAIDDLINGQINIGWVYASGQSMLNQQPSQFQAMVKHWKQQTPYKVERDSVRRFKMGMAIANFTHANSSSEDKSGGSAEGKEQNAFQASKLYYEEKSSWKTNVDLSPRLGASRLKSKPIRELGTPGSGTGIEQGIRDAKHNFEPGVMCPVCKELSWLHPLGNLLKPKVTLEGNFEYFNNRGEILDFHGTEDNPFVACSNCNADITTNIKDCQLYSRQSLLSADEFLDSIPEDTIYYPSISIYLSPLLKVPDDEYRLRDLIKDGLDPESVLIYHQNKLGLESKFTVTGITPSDYEAVVNLKPYEIDNPIRIVGIDQGTGTHYLVDLEVDAKDFKRKNIRAVIEIEESNIISYLQSNQIDFAVIDNEPGRKSANELEKASQGVLVMADQRNIMTDVAKIKVEYGGLEVDCFAISNTLFQEEIFLSFIDCNYRLDCIPHRKFKKHVTSIKRDIKTGQFIRPNDHDDDFYFALVFAESAIVIYQKHHKKPGSSRSLGKPLTKYQYGYQQRKR
jgi:hypothetical protein